MMKRLFLSCLTALSLVVGLTAQELAGSRTNPVIGVVEGMWFPNITCDLGVGWERIIFNWEQHQPKGPDDWVTLNVDDRWLKAADACNREVVALLKHTPAWATDGTPGVGVPRGLDLPLDDPENYWANFVRRAVTYYASRGVHHFIIWNEPDINSDTYGYEFEGDMNDYVQMLRVAYLVAGEVNPAAVIHLAGTTYWHDVNAGRRPYVTRLVEQLVQDPEAAAHDYYFDVLSLHIYFRTDTVYDITAEMRQTLDDNGLINKQIWLNETNAAPTDDPHWPVERPVFQIGLQEQSAFLVQSAALSLAAGADRVAAYKLYDQQLPPGAESFGLLNPADATPRPAFAAWQTVAEQFRHVKSSELAQTDRVNVVRLVHHNGQQTLVAWARSDQSAQIEIEASHNKANRLAVDGSITVLRPENGHYTLNLSPALCEAGEGCFLGGAVVMLVQPQSDLIIRQIIPNETVTLTFN